MYAFNMVFRHLPRRWRSSSTGTPTAHASVIASTRPKQRGHGRADAREGWRWVLDLRPYPSRAKVPVRPRKRRRRYWRQRWRIAGVFRMDIGFARAGSARAEVCFTATNVARAAQKHTAIRPVRLDRACGHIRRRGCELRVHEEAAPSAMADPRGGSSSGAALGPQRAVSSWSTVGSQLHAGSHPAGGGSMFILPLVYHRSRRLPQHRLHMRLRTVRLCYTGGPCDPLVAFPGNNALKEYPSPVRKASPACGSSATSHGYGVDPGEATAAFGSRLHFEKPETSIYEYELSIDDRMKSTDEFDGS